MAIQGIQFWCRHFQTYSRPSSSLCNECADGDRQFIKLSEYLYVTRYYCSCTRWVFAACWTCSSRCSSCCISSSIPINGLKCHNQSTSKSLTSYVRCFLCLLHVKQADIFSFNWWHLTSSLFNQRKWCRNQILRSSRNIANQQSKLQSKSHLYFHVEQCHNNDQLCAS